MCKYEGNIKWIPSTIAVLSALLYKKSKLFKYGGEKWGFNATELVVFDLLGIKYTKYPRRIIIHTERYRGKKDPNPRQAYIEVKENHIKKCLSELYKIAKAKYKDILTEIFGEYEWTYEHLLVLIGLWASAYIQFPGELYKIASEMRLHQGPHDEDVNIIIKFVELRKKHNLPEPQRIQDLRPLFEKIYNLEFNSPEKAWAEVKDSLKREIHTLFRMGATPHIAHEEALKYILDHVKSMEEGKLSLFPSFVKNHVDYIKERLRDYARKHKIDIEI